MNVLIVYAHPEPRSLNGALKSFAVGVLERAGHNVQISDLCANDWKIGVGRSDFAGLDANARFRPVLASREAFRSKTLSSHVVAEQAKLLWSDAVILQFPFWWFGMPAILKGWVERVYAFGFAFGVGEHSDTRWGDRYGEGVFAGKRAMLVVTAGGWPQHYRERSINGSIDDLLFPINHGILFYPGFDVLPPFVVYRADFLDDDGFLSTTADLERRLLGLFSDEPIPYRKQNGGDYTIPDLELKPGREAVGTTGFALHMRGVPTTERNATTTMGFKDA